MNPFTHDNTISAANATAGAVLDRGPFAISHSVIAAEDIGKSYVSPDLDDNLTHSPKEDTMTTMYTQRQFDVDEVLDIPTSDEAREEAELATAEVDEEPEQFLVGRPVVEEEQTLETLEEERDAELRAIRLNNRAERRVDETGEAPELTDEELHDRGFAPLNELAYLGASEDVIEVIEGEFNLGMTTLDRADSEPYLTLTMRDSSFFELAMRDASDWKLIKFSKRLLDFSAYDLQAQPEMQFVADSLESTGRLLDSHGFEAVVWEDDHNRAFIRHCVNVAQSLKLNLYFDKRAQKLCNHLLVKRAPGVSKRVIVVGSFVAEHTPLEITESAMKLTGVYAYEAPVKAPSAAEAPVKAVEVVTQPKVAQAQKVNPAPASAVQATTSPKAAAQPKQEKPAKSNNGAQVKAPLAQKKPARQFLAVAEEVTMKVVRFAKYGVILQDALGNEGFLGNVGKVNGGSTKHYRLVVKIGDEVKVKVLTVDGTGFVKTSLLCINDLTSHYLSCLKIGDVQEGVVMRRRSEFCFYVTLGGPIDGILAVRDIPNLPEVKDKLRADSRLNVRITSVNPEKRNFHIVIEPVAPATN